MSRSVRESALELAVWWSVWTLADTYLIRFTPWSEVAVVLCVCAIVYLPKAKQCVAKRYAAHAQHIQVAIDRI